MIGNPNTAELRPVELARAYLLKKMMTKVLREDAAARCGTVLVQLYRRYVRERCIVC